MSGDVGSDVGSGLSEERVLDFLIDAALLGECHGFVGKFSSSLSRLAYSLMATRGGVDCLQPFVSLDIPWCFGLACRKEGDERLKARWRHSAKSARQHGRKISLDLESTLALREPKRV